ncbi:hypothetical protein WN943_026093 [Citrus x changshan-huyou]
MALICFLHCRRHAISQDYQYHYQATVMSFFLLNCYRVQYRMAASTTTKGESYVKREEKLRNEVRAMLQQDDHKVVVDFDPLHLLELIDTLQRLGLSYHLRMKTKALWWWKKTRLVEKLNFARDRLMENFFWTVG